MWVEGLGFRGSQGTQMQKCHIILPNLRAPNWTPKLDPHPPIFYVAHILRNVKWDLAGQEGLMTYYEGSDHLTGVLVAICIYIYIEIDVYAYVMCMCFSRIYFFNSQYTGKKGFAKGSRRFTALWSSMFPHPAFARQGFNWGGTLYLDLYSHMI